MSATTLSDIRDAESSRRRATRGSRWLSNGAWYVVLTAIAVITVFPFAWMLLTSLKGPNDLITSVPPQFLPNDPTLADYVRVLGQPADPELLPQLTTVAIATGRSTCSWPRWPRIRSRRCGSPVASSIFYLLLATLIVPAQLTYIPSFILAVNVFHYYDTLAALIFPNIVSAFNIFLLRQAFRGVPDELVDAARVDGAGEWRIWWSILLPIIRPSLAAVAIFTFVTSWNDFLWPSLMLHTPEGLTLPVGLATLQGFFSSDFRSIAAGVTMTIIPILLVLHPGPALLRARADRRGQGVTDPPDAILSRVMLAFDGVDLPGSIGGEAGPRHLRPASRCSAPTTSVRPGRSAS